MRLLLSKRTDMIDLHFYGNNKYALRLSKRYVTCWAVYSCVICWVLPNPLGGVLLEPKSS